MMAAAGMPTPSLTFRARDSSLLEPDPESEFLFEIEFALGKMDCCGDVDDPVAPVDVPDPDVNTDPAVLVDVADVEAAL